jgi:hypothetical protein
MDELNIKIVLLEEEMKYIKEQIEQLKRGDTNIYQQLLMKYQEPEIPIQSDKKILYNDTEYTVDNNNFLWDMDGYVSGWLNEQNEVILNSNKE